MWFVGQNSTNTQFTFTILNRMLSTLIFNIINLKYINGLQNNIQMYYYSNIFHTFNVQLELNGFNH